MSTIDSRISAQSLELSPPDITGCLPTHMIRSKIRLIKKRRVCWAFIASCFISVGHAAEAPDLSGAELYAAFCASCHGPTAQGDGPVAPLLKTPVPDLTFIAARRGGRFSPQEMHRIIDGRTTIRAHGTREMPIWGSELYGYKSKDPARRKRVNKMIAELVDYLGFIQTMRVD